MKQSERTDEAKPVQAKQGRRRQNSSLAIRPEVKGTKVTITDKPAKLPQRVITLLHSVLSQLP